jgi:hypothetical protein
VRVDLLDLFLQIDYLIFTFQVFFFIVLNYCSVSLFQTIYFILQLMILFLHLLDLFRGFEFEGKFFFS